MTHSTSKNQRVGRHRAPEEPTADDVLVGSPTVAQVVFVGPVGVGKSTAVRSLSNVDVVGTEASCTASGTADETDKSTTTVGIEYGMWTRPDGRRVGLFGTAGQTRFVSARSALHNPGTPTVLMLFGNSPDIDDHVRYWLGQVGGAAAAGNLVVAVNHPTTTGLNRIARALREAGLSERTPLLTIDPRVPGDVRDVVVTLLDPTEP